ncbi:MAG: EAL domain-containing protein [Neptuniibacter sp.]
MKNNVQLIEMVERQRFGVEYQPIIDTNSGEVFAYEALARFFNPAGDHISPLQVFCALHDSPLMLAQVELQLKRLQLRFRPDHYPLFINLDPHAFSMLKDSSGGNELLRRLGNEDSLIVELIENTDVNDAQMSNEVSDLFHKAGISIALDDVGAPGTMVALNILNDVDYIKFDRFWFNPNSESMLPLLESLVRFARDSGKKRFWKE